MTRVRQAAAPHLPAVAGLTVVTLAYFWSVLPHFGTHMVNGGGDAANVIWSWLHIYRSVAAGRGPFRTSGMFFPVGVDLAFHTDAPLIAFLVWPVVHIGGLAVAVNTLEATSALVAAVSTYVLALRLGASRGPAFVAGVAFAFAPYRWVHAANHYTLIHTELLPLAALAFLRLLDRPSRSRSAVLGVVLGAAYLTVGYLFVFVLVVLVCFGVPRRWVLPAAELGRLLGIAGLVACILAAPLLVAQMSAVVGGDLPRLPGWGGADLYSADLFSWFVPSRHLLWTGPGIRWLGSGEAYVGWSVLGLALVAMKIVKRERRAGLLGMAGVFGLLALGPFLHVGGRTGTAFSLRGSRFTVPLPWMVITYLPLAGNIRAPIRAAVGVELALALLSALGLTGLIEHRPGWSGVTTTAATILIFLEFLPPRFPTVPTRVPAPYEAIRAQKGSGAILELPLQWSTGLSVTGDQRHEDSLLLYYDAVADHPTVNGSVARYPPARLRRLMAIPLLDQVVSAEEATHQQVDLSFSASDLRAIGVQFVIYHRRLGPPALGEYIGRLGLPVLAEDGDIIAWRVPGEG